MKKGIALLLAVAGLTFAASTADAATYYVTPATQSTETGSLATPYKTLNGALSGLTLAAGDVILVGKGAIAVSGTMSIPAGVTVRGGYLGGWGAGAWANPNPTLYASAFTFDSGSVFNIGAGAVLDGVWIFKTNGSYWTLTMQNAGGILRNSTLKFNYQGVYTYANGVTIENSVIDQQYGCCGHASVYNDGVLTLQNSKIWTRYGHGAMYYGRGIVRGNEFHGERDYWFYDLLYVSNGGVDVYNNLFDGGARDQGTAIYLGWNGSGPANVENNNITNVYEAVETWSYEEWWGWYYPNTIRNNVIWNVGGGNDTEGLYLGGEYPYEWTQFSGNCVMDSNWYLYTYEGVEKYGYGTALLDQMLPEIINNNTTLTAPPATPTSSACNGKGVQAVARKSKPVAHGYAADMVTGGTYAANTAVHAGQRVTLNGRDHHWNGGATESKSFEGGELTYLWSQQSGPAAVTTYSRGNLGEVVTGVLSTPGTYVFKLQVRNDNPGSDNVISDPFYVTVYVGNKVTVLTSAGAVRGTYNHLQEAIDAAQWGDTVQLPAGIFQPGEDWDLDGGRVYSKSNLTIKGAGSGANGTLFLMNCQDNAFDIEYSSNITVRDIKFSDATDCDYEAIYVDESTNVLVDNIAFSGKGEDPWYNGWVVDSEYSTITVQNSRIEFAEYGVYGYYGRFKILNNSFSAIYYEPIYIDSLDNYGYDSAEIVGNQIDGKWAIDDYGIYLYDLGYGSGPFVVRGNTMKNFYCCEMIEIDYANYGAPVIIEGNTLFNDRRWYGSSHYTYGMYLYYVNAEITNNIVSGLSYSGIRIRNSYFNGGEEVAIQGNVIAYNGMASNNYPGIENDGISCPNGYSGSGSCRYTAWASNNVFFGNTGGAVSQVEMRDGNVFEDPKFVNADAGNFMPAAGSPLAQLPGIGLPAAALLPAPAGLQAEPLVLGARVTFDAVEGATGYTLFWGDAADALVQSQNLGNERYAVVDGLATTPVYFAVQTKGGLRSAPVVVTPLAEEPVPQSTPAVFGVEPTLIRTGTEAELTVTGDGFGAGAKVLLGSTEAGAVEVVDANTIKIKTAAMKPGIYPVVVVNKDLGRGALPQAVTVRSTSPADEAGGCSSAHTDAGLWLVLLPLAAVWLRRRAFSYPK